jgi:hypothetical protein
MNISIEATGSDALANLIEFTQEGVGWRKFNQRREAYRKRIERHVAKVFGVYPPERSPLRKFRFASKESQGWFWANIGGKYQRTGALGKSWRAKLSVTRAGFSIAVGSAADAAEFVYSGDGFRQVPGHSDTGWPDADERFLSIAAYAETELIREIDALIAEAL